MFELFYKPSLLYHIDNSILTILMMSIWQALFVLYMSFIKNFRQKMSHILKTKRNLKNNSNMIYYLDRHRRKPIVRVTNRKVTFVETATTISICLTLNIYILTITIVHAYYMKTSIIQPRLT